VQAEAIVKHIPYVIGMSKAIGDKAAIEFAVGFYRVTSLLPKHQSLFALLIFPYFQNFALA
jgi:hypothetical protein